MLGINTTIEKIYLLLYKISRYIFDGENQTLWKNENNISHRIVCNVCGLEMN